MKNNSKVFDAMEKDPILSRVRTFVITHPKKQDMATIQIVYPKDGAGRLKAFCVDRFGQECVAQQGYAGGYGYDKAGAAMSGFVIDGKLITDHCAEDEQSKLFLRAYGRSMLRQDADAAKVIEEKARKQGYRFANWTSEGGYQPNAWHGYQSCYKEQGLDYLRALGYNVIQVG